MLTTEQFGFRRKLTTEKVTYNLTNKIVNAMNNKLIVRGILCKLEKIFDSVNHYILLSKLECCGIIGTYNALYKCHLPDEYQRISIENEKINNASLPNWVNMKHSVPQGSFIGNFSLSYIHIHTQCVRVHARAQFTKGYK
jgi:hypothetical protein